MDEQLLLSEPGRMSETGEHFCAVTLKSSALFSQVPEVRLPSVVSPALPCNTRGKEPGVPYIQPLLYILCYKRHLGYTVGDGSRSTTLWARWWGFRYPVSFFFWRS